MPCIVQTFVLVYLCKLCLLSKPEAVEHMSIRIYPDHNVLCGGVVDEGSFGMHKEHIRNPDLFHQSTIESHAFIGFTSKRQSLVLPVVSQV